MENIEIVEGRSKKMLRSFFYTCILVLVPSANTTLTEHSRQVTNAYEAFQNRATVATD